MPSKKVLLFLIGGEMHKWEEENVGANKRLTLCVKGINMYDWIHDFTQEDDQFGAPAYNPHIEGVVGMHFDDKYTVHLLVHKMYTCPMEIAQIKRYVEDKMGLFPKTRCNVQITDDGVDLR
jgi:hypothetical protein